MVRSPSPPPARGKDPLASEKSQALACMTTVKYFQMIPFKVSHARGGVFVTHLVALCLHGDCDIIGDHEILTE